MKNFADEFFYDDTFEDYASDYIMRFMMNDVTTNIVSIPDSVYIFQDMPDAFYEIPIKNIIGVYYPKKDELGIYGNYNVICREELFSIAKLKPGGYYTMENERITNYTLQCVYLDFYKRAEYLLE